MKLTIILLCLLIFLKDVLAITEESEWSITSRVEKQLFLYTISFQAKERIIETFLVFEEDLHSIKAKPLYQIIFINSYVRDGNKLYLTLERELIVPLSQKLKSKYDCPKENFYEFDDGVFKVCALPLKSITEFSNLTLGLGERQVLRFELNPKGLILHRKEGRLLLKRTSYYKNNSLETLLTK